jgi:hypothetical protein
MKAAFRNESISSDEVIADSEEDAIAFWLESHTDGTEVGIDSNICECETWVVGEPRCSCGDRRIHAEAILLDTNCYLVYPDAH